MVHKITTYLKEGHLYSAIEVCDILKTRHYFFLEVERKKEELLVSEKKRYDDATKLINGPKKNCPSVLIINTNDVLIKIIASGLNNNPEALVEKAFPNFNFENFYYELTPFGERTIVSIIKKEKIKELLQELSMSKISVVHISLGIAALRNLKDYIAQETIKTSNKILLFSKNTIHAVSQCDALENNEIITYTVNGLKIEKDFLLCFAGIFGFVTKTEFSFSNFSELRNKYLSDFKNSRFFSIVSKSATGFILGLLLLNFLFFNHYFQKVEELETVSEVNIINKKKLSELSTRVEEKERRVDAILASGNSKSSYYLDIIGQSIPNSILIQQIEYQPLLKPLRDSKPLEILDNVIIISGSALNTTEFSIWIKQLETEQWIAKVEALDFDYQNKESSLFSIKIVLNEQ